MNEDKTKPSYLYRDDGARFTRNINGTYSMDNSNMYKPYYYSFKRLMLTGLFGPWPPSNIGDKTTKDN